MNDPNTQCADESSSAVWALAQAALQVINTSPLGEQLRDTSLGRDVASGKSTLMVSIALPAGPVQVFAGETGADLEEVARLELPGRLRGLHS